MNNLKKKSKTKIVNKSKPKKNEVRFIVEREYKGTSTFTELFEPIVEMMIREKYSEQIRL